MLGGRRHLALQLPPPGRARLLRPVLVLKPMLLHGETWRERVRSVFMRRAALTKCGSREYGMIRTICCVLPFQRNDLKSLNYGELYYSIVL